jgi:hypothetical protein
MWMIKIAQMWRGRSSSAKQVAPERQEGQLKASTLCFRAAVILVIAGMLWGMQMAISQDHSAFPAHAHLNLLGWVTLFLFGIYYRLHPVLENSKVALAQVWIWIAGTVIQAIGVGLVHTGTPQAEPAAAGGSIIVIVAMLMFGWLVFRADAGTKVVTQPAE